MILIKESTSLSETRKINGKLNEQLRHRTVTARYSESHYSEVT